MTLSDIVHHLMIRDRLGQLEVGSPNELFELLNKKFNQKRRRNEFEKRFLVELLDSEETSCRRRSWINLPRPIFFIFS